MAPWPHRVESDLGALQDILPAPPRTQEELIPLGEEVEVRAWPDPSSAPPPAATLSGADGVIHLLGEPVAQRWSSEAKERIRMEAPEGKIGHAELEIGDSLLMLSDAFPGATSRPPTELGGTTAGAFMYVEDVDAVVKRAVESGATITMEIADQFWGDRFGSITDPFGHSWSIATHVEDVPPEEMAERAKAAMAEMSSSG